MRVFLAPLAALLLCGFTQPRPVVFDASGPGLAAGGIAQIQGLLSRPEGNGPFPAIVILHTCGGVRQNLSHVWPALLVERGYVSLTVDSFGSRRCWKLPERLYAPALDIRYGAICRHRLRCPWRPHLSAIPALRKERPDGGGWLFRSAASPFISEFCHPTQGLGRRTASRRRYRSMETVRCAKKQFRCRD